MALGRRCSSMKSCAAVGGEECPPFEFARIRSFGRKRIVISQNLECCWDSEMSPRTPLKRLCSEPMAMELEAVMAEIDEQQPEEKSVLESLPQEILIKVLCGVNHEDLKQLLLVSKPITEAALIAKESHFAYSTPTKFQAFRSPTTSSEFDEIEAPGAPSRAARRLSKSRRRLSEKEVSDLSVALFSSSSSSPPKKGLFMEMEM